MTTQIGHFIETCKEIQTNRDDAKSYEDRQYWQRVMDTAVEDLMTIRAWHRRTARKRLKRMRKGRKQ